MTSDAQSATAHSEAVTQQGHYAGPVTRLAAFALDQVAIVFSFSLTTATVAWAVSLVTSGDVELDLSTAWVTVLAYGVWAFTYFAYPWAVSGKTIGMAVLGIRVVTAEGAPCNGRSAVLRTLSFPLGFITLGIGFLPIIFGRHRRAVYDRIAGTAVVYSWDARAARWRFLARENDPTAAGS